MIPRCVARERTVRARDAPENVAAIRSKGKEASEAMQSSLGGAFRSLLMLACLVVVPLVAMSGRWLQELVTKVADNTRSRINLAGSTKSSDEAPPFRAASAKRDETARGTLLGAWPSFSSVPEKSQAMPPRKAEGDLGRTGAIIPTVFNEPPAANCGGVQAGPMRDPAAEGQPRHEVERFRQIEEKLRALGAVHYLLEQWGDNGEFYEFRCRMPIAGNLTAVRYFVATDSDGLRAMSRVLGEIEAWKATAPE